MKYSLFTILLIVLFSSFSEKKDSTSPNSDYLDSIAPFMESFSRDTSMIFECKRNEDESIHYIVGKFISKKHIYAMEIREDDKCINFYRYNANRWISSGTGEIEFDLTFRIEFDDMDTDGYNEVIVFSPPNMNGNTWQTVFHYIEESDSIRYAGSFTTDFEIDKKNKLVKTWYEGSSYMPTSKTIYKWNKTKLIPMKEVEILAREFLNKMSVLVFRYYENDSLEEDSLVLKIEAPYNKKEHQNIWDNFFDNN